MPIEKQVCSLELAKRLKELGVKQGSYFYWNAQHIWVAAGKDIEYDKDNAISAFTAAELGEILPVALEHDEVLAKYKGALFLAISKPYEQGTDAEYTKEEADLMFGTYQVAYTNMEGWIVRGGDTLADAMAKMVVCLAELKYITL